MRRRPCWEVLRLKIFSTRRLYLQQQKEMKGGNARKCHEAYPRPCLLTSILKKILQGLPPTSTHDNWWHWNRVKCRKSAENSSTTWNYSSGSFGSCADEAKCLPCLKVFQDPVEESSIYIQKEVLLSKDGMVCYSALLQMYQLPWSWRLIIDIMDAQSCQPRSRHTTWLEAAPHPSRNKQANPSKNIERFCCR